MYSDALEDLIEAVIADGEITQKEWQVLTKRATAEGVDLDELEIYVNGKLAKLKREASKAAIHSAPVPPPTPQPTGAPRQGSNSKYGVVNKCPQCGGVVEAGSAKCNECGYVFRGIEAISSRQKLSELLIEIEKREYKASGLFGLIGGSIFEDEKRDAARARAITDFPVPNAKEDLLEFIAYLKPHTNRGFFSIQPNEKMTVKAYKQKYQECVTKAKLFFADDPQFKALIK